MRCRILYETLVSGLSYALVLVDKTSKTGIRLLLVSNIYFSSRGHHDAYLRVVVAISPECL